MKIPAWFRRRLLDAARRVYCKRPADFVIAPYGVPYLRRWYVIPRNRWFNVYLHQFLVSDDDRALHDHPWVNTSVVLSGSYIEWRYRDQADRSKGLTFDVVTAGDVVNRKAEALHRIELASDGSVWTLFITGRVERTWGFQVGDRWVPHDEYAEVIEGVSKIRPTDLELDQCAALVRDMYDLPESNDCGICGKPWAQCSGIDCGGDER